MATSRRWRALPLDLFDVGRVTTPLSARERPLRGVSAAPPGPGILSLCCQCDFSFPYLCARRGTSRDRVHGVGRVRAEVPEAGGPDGVR